MDQLSAKYVYGFVVLLSLYFKKKKVLIFFPVNVCLLARRTVYILNIPVTVAWIAWCVSSADTVHAKVQEKPY